MMALKYPIIFKMGTHLPRKALRLALQYFLLEVMQGGGMARGSLSLCPSIRSTIISSHFVCFMKSRHIKNDSVVTRERERKRERERERERDRDRQTDRERERDVVHAS